VPSKDGRHKEFRKEVSCHVNTLINVAQRRVNTVTYVRREQHLASCAAWYLGALSPGEPGRRRDTHVHMWHEVCP